MSRFTLPRDIYYGANALENLKNLKGSRAVLVLGRLHEEVRLCGQGPGLSEGGRH